MEKKFFYFGIPITKIVRVGNIEKKYFLGIKYKEKVVNIIDRFEDLFENKVKKLENRKISVIVQNLGEAVVFARTYKYWYNENELIFVKRYSHLAVFRMFCPELPIFFIGEGALKEEKVIGTNQLKPLLSNKDVVEMLLLKKHFYQCWQEYLKIKFTDVIYSKAIIPENIKKEFYNKIKVLNYDLSNFVLCIPFAISQVKLSKSFWEILEIKLRLQGISVIYNSDLFSLEEIYLLASKAKAIIALRSGLNDVLCEINVPQFIIYTHDIKGRDLQLMYSLKGFPWAEKNQLKEYNTSFETEQVILSNILYYILLKE